MPNSIKPLTGLLVNARLAWRLFRDARLPAVTKFIIPGLAAAYLLMPADLLPDILPGLGQLDDLAVLALGIKLFIDAAPAWLVQEHRDGLAGRAPVGSRPASARPTGGTAASPQPGKTVDGEYRVIE